MYNNFRRVLCVAVTILFVVFGLTEIAVAANVNKHFALSLVLGTIDNTQQDTTYTAIVDNDNPSGSSAQFGSFVISIDKNNSGITITGADPDLRFGNGQTVTVSGSSVSVSGLSPNVKATQSYELKLHIKGCGDGNTWTGIVYTGTAFTGTTYQDDHKGSETTDVPCGTLACGDTLGVPGTISAGQLGDFTQDGQTIGASACQSNNYYVTNLLSTQNFFHFRWTGGSLLAFYYVANIPATNTTRFAWVGNGDTPVFDDALTAAALKCELNPNITTAGDQVPEPIGKVLSDNGGKTIKVDTSAFNYPLQAPPFHVTIGPKSSEEYLLVTKINGQTWTVERGKPASKHPVATLVMSTIQPPTPVGVTHAGYTAGAPAQMCFAGSIGDATTAIYDFDPLGNGWGGIQ